MSFLKNLEQKVRDMGHSLDAFLGIGPAGQQQQAPAASRFLPETQDMRAAPSIPAHIAQHLPAGGAPADMVDWKKVYEGNRAVMPPRLQRAEPQAQHPLASQPFAGKPVGKVDAAHVYGQNTPSRFGGIKPPEEKAPPATQRMPAAPNRTVPMSQWKPPGR